MLIQKPSLLPKIRSTVGPPFNEPQLNEVLDIMNDILRPGQSYIKMYGIEPWYNEPRYNKIFWYDKHNLEAQA